ncbi:head-tail joining protein, partial [Rhodoplanes roseus]
DFDALVLGPTMAAFGRPVEVRPIKSRPGAPAYRARGIWSSKPVDVAMLGDGVLSSQTHTLGIRSSEHPAPLQQGDRIDIPAHGSLPRVGLCVVEDGDDDGQGAATLTLKVIGP